MADVIPLHAHHRKLVIRKAGADFLLAMEPARTNLERSAVTHHDTPQEARSEARQLMRWFPDVFVALVDAAGASNQ